MSWFVDASVVVAILTTESDWELQSDRLDEETERLWSAVARWEATAAVKTRLDVSPSDARAVVEEFGRFNRLAFVPIGEAEAELALDAFQRYGKGTRHPAQLNMGDCFAYACAKSNGSRLLYKGNDFTKTDLA